MGSIRIEDRLKCPYCESYKVDIVDRNKEERSADIKCRDCRKEWTSYEDY